MEVTVEKAEDVHLVKIEGDIDGTTSEALREKLSDYLSSNSLMVIDLSKCAYISSAGLRVLLIIAKQLTRIGGKGALARLSKELEDIMEMTGFEHIFPAYKDVETAVKALSKES